MAATIVTHARNGSRVMSKIMQRLHRGSCMSTIANQSSGLRISRMKRRCWWIADADPAVSAASHAAAPVQVGDFAYRKDSDEVFICSRAPAAATAATFIQLHT